MLLTSGGKYFYTSEFFSLTSARCSHLEIILLSNSWPQKQPLDV